MSDKIAINDILQINTGSRLVYLGEGFARPEMWHPERSATGGHIPANDDPATGKGSWHALAGRPDRVKLTDAQIAAWIARKG